MIGGMCSMMPYGTGICCYAFIQFFYIASVHSLCVACNAVITVKHTLIECADMLEIRKKYFEERSLYSLFRNVIPEIFFDFLREIGVFYKI